MTGELLRASPSVLSHNVFRARPWFEPGTWGRNETHGPTGGQMTFIAGVKLSDEIN